MKEIWNYLIILFLITIIRWLLPKFKKLVVWLINKFVALMEKLISGSKMGDKKKRWVLRFLRVFGIKANQITEELIENAVESLNSKKIEAKNNIVFEVKDDIDDEIDKYITK